MTSVPVALVLLLALAPRMEPAGQTPVPAGDVRISVDARGVSLGTLLREFAALAQADLTVLDPNIEPVPVTVKLDNVPASDAFRAILLEAGVDFSIWAGTGPNLRIIVQGRTAGSGTTATARSAGAPGGKGSEEAYVARATQEAEATAAEEQAKAASDTESSVRADPMAAFLTQPPKPAAAETPASLPVDPFARYLTLLPKQRLQQ